MSEQINKLLCTLPQSFTTAEQKIGRDNIDAQKSITYSYQDSQITAIDGSAVGNPAALTGINHDYNLSGLGTTLSLLGLADPVKFSASGTAVDSLVSSVNVGNKGFSASVPSAWTAEFTYNRGKFSYEWPSAHDTEHHEGLTSHTLITPANVHLSSHDCSYITHNVVDLDVDNGLRMWQGYSSGSLQSGIYACVSGYSNGPTIQFQQGTANEYVDIPSIRRWNGYSAGVSAGNGLTGNGTSGSPLGLANPSIISSNSHSSYRADNFVMVSASGGDRSYLNEFVLEFQSAGTSFSVTPASIDLWNSYSAGRGWAESSNSLSTGYGGNQVTAASQYPDGAGNWVARTVKASGIPDSTLYGFGSKASNANGSLVGSNGQWLAYHPGYSAVYLTGTATTYDSSYLPTGVTWPMRVDVWNLGDGNDKNIKTDTFHGATSDLHYGDSATIWYVPSLDRWTDMVNI